MTGDTMLNYIKEVIENIPGDWLTLTTHRLDIYEEKLAKTQFLEQFESLYKDNNAAASALKNLPTAYDYIRLGHPLSCILEWGIAHLNNLPAKNVISFSSKTIPVLAVLRKNLLAKKNTRILYSGEWPAAFDVDLLRLVYGYDFEVQQVEKATAISAFEGSTIFIADQGEMGAIDLNPNIDFFICPIAQLGSLLIVHGEKNESYISEIQHVRRRETVAMTPVNCLTALKQLVGQSNDDQATNVEADKALVQEAIATITGMTTKALIASSGLSIQYAILMGLIHDAMEKHPGKCIRIIVPTNCYGGTNDQARRVAACLEHVAVVDWAVDGDNDMVQSIETILATMAQEDAVPLIIAEIPTNPRVEVPDLLQLKAVLTAARKTSQGEKAIDPVFILDQTFCPNVRLLEEGEVLSAVKTISFSSGSKFPSGGLCTAGYCVGNKKAEGLMEKIALHLQLCDNEATNHQYYILAKLLPSMLDRIHDAYKNTRAFVTFIREALPAAKINFVSTELAKEGFTPSVFSLDLPTKGNTAEEKEEYKRALNLKLINLMITEMPYESKCCVSYGQLNGIYWTIPATSTQGTTKEGDKDYIVRVALSPTLDLEAHKKVFLKFVKRMG